MEPAEFALVALALVAAVVTVDGICRRIGLSAPLILTALGGAVSFVPAVPTVHLDPHTVLIGFLPPLLYAAAINTSLIDLGRDRRQIIGLSVFLVLGTAAAVGLVAWWMVATVPFAIALALGGVVAPPDAIAATAVARRIGLPRRVVSVLEGESLFNDATALVIVSTSIAAFGHAVTPGDVTRSFVISAFGGIAIGYLAAKALRFVRRRVQDTTTNVALSFMTPWLVYVPAEEVHASGVIAVVVCGVLLGHTAPLDQTASARVSERLNWTTLQFILENLVFLLIGLQVQPILHDVRTSSLGVAHTILVAVAVLATVIVTRAIWLMGWALINRYGPHDPDTMSVRESVVASWAGMRGVVTLAAASLLPEDAPERSVLIFVALVVTISTLVLQGFTLGRLAKAVDLHGPDPREDALQYAQTLQMAVRAGNERLEQELTRDPEVATSVVLALKAQGERRANLGWERLGRSDVAASTTSVTYRKLRMAMLEAERAKVLALRDKGLMDSEVITDIMDDLDVEESMIARSNEDDREARDQILLTPEQRQFGCPDLAQAPLTIDPVHPEGCLECEREGLTPVHLRLCLTCGNVGCCDSSDGKHASKHYAQTGHPVMRSFEPGEAWRWCFPHQLLG
ncbi:Na+/H+ antiporter [Calidifontibacter terrae]